MSNSKFIFTILVLIGIVLAPVTGSAASHKAIHTRSFDAPIFANAKGSLQVNIDTKKPTRMLIRNGNYLIQKYINKDSRAKSFTVASQDSWEVPVAKMGRTIGLNRFKWNSEHIRYN